MKLIFRHLGVTNPHPVSFLRCVRTSCDRQLNRVLRAASAVGALIAVTVPLGACSAVPAASTPSSETVMTTEPKAGGCTGAPDTPGGRDPWGGCWPGPNNTGVPPDTRLRNVPQDLSSGTGWSWDASIHSINVTGCDVNLDSLNINGDIYVRDGNGTQSAATPCVTLTNSKINGFIDLNDACLVKQCGPLVMTDDEIAIPQSADRSSLLDANWFVWRINSHGGHGTLVCNGHCEVHDSWIHGLYLERSFHYNAIGSTGDGDGRFIIDHNSMSCGDFWAENPDTTDTKGCSADLGLYGDFAPITNVTVSHNYFAPAVNTGPYTAFQPAYCFNTNNPQAGKPYPNATNEVVIDNVFAHGYNGKCGLYGPVSSWRSGDGNMWRGNMWNDGTPLKAPG